MSTSPPRPVYVLKLTAPDGGDIRKLRWVLKRLLRQLGLRCISLEIQETK
jgi:hypothetical protein